MCIAQKGKRGFVPIEGAVAHSAGSLPCFVQDADGACQRRDTSCAAENRRGDVLDACWVLDAAQDTIRRGEWTARTEHAVSYDLRTGTLPPTGALRRGVCPGCTLLGPYPPCQSGLRWGVLSGGGWSPRTDPAQWGCRQIRHAWRFPLCASEWPRPEMTARSVHSSSERRPSFQRRTSPPPRTQIGGVYPSRSTCMHAAVISAPPETVDVRPSPPARLSTLPSHTTVVATPLTRLLLPV